jgi:hypothetical protein
VGSGQVRQAGEVSKVDTKPQQNKMSVRDWRDKVKKDLPKATGKQVAMLHAKAAEKGLRGYAFLEWLEFDSGLDIMVLQPEHILQCDVDRIVKALEAL